VVTSLADGSALLPSEVNRIAGVALQLEKFKATVFEFKGDTHRPYYLMLLWGTLIFKGVLTSMDIEYRLFGPDGTPLRAVAKCAFKGSITDGQRLRQDNLMSPDVTHKRTFKASDKLPLMADDIYTDQRYYIDVAKANNLDSFRSIKPGTSLDFLPLE
jgi:nucleoid-associated protein YgaU